MGEIGMSAYSRQITLIENQRSMTQPTVRESCTPHSFGCVVDHDMTLLSGD